MEMNTAYFLQIGTSLFGTYACQFVFMYGVFYSNKNAAAFETLRMCKIT